MTDTANRKVFQIGIAIVDSGLGQFPAFVALCDDGTMWAHGPPQIVNGKRTQPKDYWEQIPDVPQGT
jgi:hypothetical protein